MPEQHSKTRIIRRIIVYALMTISVLVLSTVLLFLMLGYRFNRDSGTFQQGGLVQFISQPTGAHVTVGSAELANKTRSKITLNPGTYTVKMTLDGYRQWQKKVVVRAGQVLWLNSVHFVPTSPKTSSVLALKTLSSTAAKVDGKYFAYMEDATRPVISYINVNDDAPKVKSIVLPEASYSAGTTHAFTLVDMDDDNHHVLIRHEVDGQTEWLMTDLEDASKTRRLGGDAPMNVGQVYFSPRSNDEVFLLYKDGSVHKQKLSDGTLSATLLTNVATMSLSQQGTIFYAAVPLNGVTKTGYLSYNQTAARTLKSYKTTQPVRVASNQYYDEFYVTTAVGTTVTISRYDSFPQSSDDSVLRASDVKTITVDDPVSHLSAYASGRFVAIQDGASQTLYDLELGEQSDTPIKGASTLTGKLPWLDDYHYWNDASGVLRQYEFDGTNQADITKVAPGFSAVYNDNLKYLYSIGKTDDGYQLQRTLMVIN